MRIIILQVVVYAYGHFVLYLPQCSSLIVQFLLHLVYAQLSNIITSCQVLGDPRFIVEIWSTRQSSILLLHNESNTKAPFPLPRIFIRGILGLGGNRANVRHRTKHRCPSPAIVNPSREPKSWVVDFDCNL